MKLDMLELFFLKMVDRPSKHKLLYLGKQQLALLGFTPGQKLSLHVGFNKLAVEVAELHHEASLATLYLSGAAFTELIHYHGGSLWLVFLSPKKMILGPTLAITVSSNTWKKIDKIYAIKKRALLALEKGIFFYCFHMSKVDLKSDLVEAYYLNPHKLQWMKALLPFPQVLYHRSTYPFDLYAKQTDTNNVYHKIWANPTIQKINNTYRFDKWSVYQALTSFHETSTIQPETTLLSQSALKQFLNNFTFCYVKNIYGRGGKQVFQVKKEEAAYSCKAGGKKLRQWQFESLSKLYFFLREGLGEDLILQEGVPVARLNNRPFDIRVLVQKNINAEWVITALSFRVAAAEAVVTNVAAGAKEIALAPGDNLLGSGLAMDSLKNFTLKTLSALEAFYGRLGEVGLDVGLDKDGRLWLFEANSKPSSRGYKEAASEDLCNQIFGIPLDYAKYLARSLFKKLEGDYA